MRSESNAFYVQDERYIAIEHMEEVRPGTGREAGLSHVRRDCFSVARHIRVRREVSQVRTAMVMVCVIPDLGRSAHPCAPAT